MDKGAGPAILLGSPAPFRFLGQLLKRSPYELPHCLAMSRASPAAVCCAAGADLDGVARWIF